MVAFLSFTGLVASFLTVAHSASVSSRPPAGLINNVDIFKPPSTYSPPGVIYPRSTILQHDPQASNVILATWENDSPEPPPPYFPIFRSTDLGHTWSHISNCTDQVNGWGLRRQPFLYELPRDIGSFKTGTVLCTGNSIPADGNHTKIDLYASTDHGFTWKFVVRVRHVLLDVKEDNINLIIFFFRATLLLVDQRSLITA
jgi:hypothetical protein